MAVKFADHIKWSEELAAKRSAGFPAEAAQFSNDIAFTHAGIPDKNSKSFTWNGSAVHAARLYFDQTCEDKRCSTETLTAWGLQTEQRDSREMRRPLSSGLRSGS